MNGIATRIGSEYTDATMYLGKAIGPAIRVSNVTANGTRQTRERNETIERRRIITVKTTRGM